MQRLLLAFALACCFIAPAQAQGFVVRERADPQLHDVAKSVMKRTAIGYEVEIVYNPIICNQIGTALCIFFRAHEYGHIKRNHLPQLRMGGIRREKGEEEADCWAAQNVTLEEAYAAFNFFMSPQYVGSPDHGTGPMRAERVRRCKGF